MAGRALLGRAVPAAGTGDRRQRYTRTLFREVGGAAALVGLRTDALGAAVSRRRRRAYRAAHGRQRRESRGGGRRDLECGPREVLQARLLARVGRLFET